MTVVFAQAMTGAVIVADGAALMVTFVFALPLQPLVFVTVTERVTLPELPAVKVTAFVDWPVVMVPLTIDQV